MDCTVAPTELGTHSHFCFSETEVIIKLETTPNIYIFVFLFAQIAKNKQTMISRLPERGKKIEIYNCSQKSELYQIHPSQPHFHPR